MQDSVDRIVDQWASEQPDLPAEAMAIFGRIYRIAAVAGEIMERVYARYGITRADFDVLAALRRSGPPFRLPPGALSATLMLTTAGMTGRLNRLQGAGLITRSPAATDGRSVLVTLTTQGHTVIDHAVRAGVSVQQQLLTGIADNHRHELTALLRDLLDSCVEYADQTTGTPVDTRDP